MSYCNCVSNIVITNVNTVCESFMIWCTFGLTGVWLSYMTSKRYLLYSSTSHLSEHRVFLISCISLTQTTKHMQKLPNQQEGWEKLLDALGSQVQNVCQPKLKQRCEVESLSSDVMYRMLLCIHSVPV